MADTFYIVSRNAARITKGNTSVNFTQRNTELVKQNLFYFPELTTQPRGLNFCLSFLESSISHLCPLHESLTASRPALERRILAAVDASPSRIPVVLGDFRTGRTQLLARLRERLGRTQCQHIDLERAATTPERFYQAITTASPFRVPPRPNPRQRARRSTRCSHFSISRAPAAATSPPHSCSTKCSSCARSKAFPGLRTALRELLKTLCQQRQPLRPDDALYLTGS